MTIPSRPREYEFGLTDLLPLNLTMKCGENNGKFNDYANRYL
jgi:hypothetical protein